MHTILSTLMIFPAVCILNSLSGQTLPIAYDLRNVGGTNYVTSIKSQQGGTCWTHGAMAAIEGNMMLTNVWQQAGQSGEPDLAEYHLDWWNGFNQHNNDDATPTTGSGLTVHMGGDYRVTSAYLSRGEGAVRESDAPSYTTPSLRSDSSYMYFYPRNIEWFTAGKNLQRIALLKQKIMDEGVMGTCMCVGGFWWGNIHYQPETDPSEPNHAIAIIGWNDTLTTQAPLPGAWLCKNSWGSSWGNNGYFWISYYDKHCAQEPQMGAVTFRNVEQMKYSKVYYHDYHGWRDELSNVSTAFNAFKATGFERLEAISFFTAADSVQFTATVFGSFQNQQPSDTLSVVSGFNEYSGFITVNLDSVMALTPNKNFYIAVDLSQGGHPYDRTSSVPVLLGASYRTLVTSSALPGQSFFKDAGNQWVDLTSIDSTANFCIKGLCNPMLPAKASVPSGKTRLCPPDSISQYSIPPIPSADSVVWEVIPSHAASIQFTDTSCILHTDAQVYTGSLFLKITPFNPNGAGPSDSLQIFVNPAPVLYLGEDIGTSNPWDSLTLSFGGYSSWLWSNGSTDSVTTFVVAKCPNLWCTIWLLVSDSNGCTASDTMEYVYFYSVQENDPQNFDFRIIPNPAVQEFEIQFFTDIQNSVSLLIIDALGRKVMEKRVNPDKNHIRIEDIGLKPGLYFLSVDYQGMRATRRLIINTSD